MVLISFFCILCSCAHTTSLFTDSAILEMEMLRKRSDQEQIASTERLKADSLIVEARITKEKGKEREAFWLMQLASSYYKLAISRYELQSTESRIQELESSLQQTRNELKNYKELVSELESIEQSKKKKMFPH